MTISKSDSSIILTFKIAEIRIPKLESFINKSLELTYFVFGWRVPVICKLVDKYALNTMTVSNLVKCIENLTICDGMDNDENANGIHHSVPYEINLLDEVSFKSKQYKRLIGCLVLIDCNQSTTCKVCAQAIKHDSKVISKRQKGINTPARLNAPLKHTHPNRVSLALQEERKRNKELQHRMQADIGSKSVMVDSELSADIDQIMENTKTKNDFIKLFLGATERSLNKEKKMMYHPMIIRFCLSLTSKSASAYEELRSSKILTLPSRRTLTDYKNAIMPSPGFNYKVIEELCKIACPLKDLQRFVCLSFDEMKIQENLVFDKNTERLVGFVDLGDPELNYANFQEEVIAKYALVFYVRGIASDLKYSLVYFATDGARAYQIMSIFWEAVSYLELTCRLPVVACVCDGASPNRKFFKMHNTDVGEKLQHKAQNPFCSDRYVYFFADVPHLMKTLRNCMHKSGYGDGAKRLMWNDGKDIIWTHIFKLAQDELSRDIKLAPKLTMDHVDLNPFSKMNVKLATQVLSQTTANILATQVLSQTTGQMS